MNKLKKYKPFLESNSKYSIYDFCNDLKENRRSAHLSDNFIKKWVNHFIGNGWYDKINKHVDSMWVSMKKVNMEYIDDRLLDLWDEIPNKDKWVTTSIAYGSYSNMSKEKKNKYNGLMPIVDLDDKSRRSFILCEIVFNIVWETMRIGSWDDNIFIRNTDDEIYVSDEKYNCENFKLENFSGFQGYDGKDIKWDVDGVEKTIRYYTHSKFEKIQPIEYIGDVCALYNN